MPSPYLARPIRTYEAAMREVDRGYLPDSPAIAELGKAIIAASQVVAHLCEAERHLPVGDGMNDQLRGMSDIVSDIRGRIYRLERLR
jgi:hypothetical protein